MSCNELEKREQILTHLREHTQRFCAACALPLKPDDGNLAFGNAMMIAWSCPKCKNEDLTILKENGEMLEVVQDTGEN